MATPANDPIALVRAEIIRRRNNAIAASDTYGKKNDLDMDDFETVAVELDKIVAFIDQTLPTVAPSAPSA